MTIAINLTHFIKTGSSDFLPDYFLKIALSEPEHQFIFITSSGIDEQRITSKNITPVISSPRANNPLMWKIWLDFTLPYIARKYGAEIIINTGGVCSLRTKIPQYLFLPDLSFLESPRYFPKKEVYFLKKNLPAFLKKATTVVTASHFLTKEIAQKYSIGVDKIKRCQLMPAEIYQPINWKEKELIKEYYTEGKEYFLFSGDIHPGNNLVNLLKAFSFFKKRQKSNMQLIITAKSFPVKDSFMEIFKTFKYRGEVRLLADLPEKDLAKITAAAYAFLYPSMYDCLPLFTLPAIQCEVPVITTQTSSINEIYGDAVLYADPANFEDIADKMMLLFKDENKRTEIIKRGNLKMQDINNDNLANQWWKSMLEPIG